MYIDLHDIPEFPDSMIWKQALAKVVLEAAKAHEESYVDGVGYGKSIEVAVHLADKTGSLYRPAIKMLNLWWNESLDWANEIHEAEHGPKDPSDA